MVELMCALWLCLYLFCAWLSNASIQQEQKKQKIKFINQTGASRFSIKSHNVNKTPLTFFYFRNIWEKFDLPFIWLSNEEREPFQFISILNKSTLNLIIRVLQFKLEQSKAKLFRILRVKFQYCRDYLHFCNRRAFKNDIFTLEFYFL